MLIPHPLSSQDKACDAMELFDELVECEVGMVIPHLASLINFCLEIASNTTLGDNIRVKALSFVSWLATLKKKVANMLIQTIQGPSSKSTPRLASFPGHVGGV